MNFLKSKIVFFLWIFFLVLLKLNSVFCLLKSVVLGLFKYLGILFFGKLVVFNKWLEKVMILFWGLLIGNMICW